MSTIFIAELETRLADILAKSSEARPGHKLFASFERMSDGMLVAVFDLAFSDMEPFAMFAFRREDWRMVIDLMPGEGASFPGNTWLDFKKAGESGAEKR